MVVAKKLVSVSFKLLAGFTICFPEIYTVNDPSKAADFEYCSLERMVYNY